MLRLSPIYPYLFYRMKIQSKVLNNIATIKNVSTTTTSHLELRCWGQQLDIYNTNIYEHNACNIKHKSKKIYDICIVYSSSELQNKLPIFYERLEHRNIVSKRNKDKGEPWLSGNRSEREYGGGSRRTSPGS